MSSVSRVDPVGYSLVLSARLVRNVFYELFILRVVNKFLFFSRYNDVQLSYIFETKKTMLSVYVILRTDLI